MENDYSKELEALRQKLKNRSLSVLVGAGFSKNVHDKLFPSWGQLLGKMVVRMNGRHYDSDFERQTGKKPDQAPDEYSIYLQEQVDQYIQQTGYLAVVSNYIKKIGYRESVDVYIEENTPLAVRKEGRLLLRHMEEGQVKETPINEKDLELHTKLIKLPWNNIYTTNYDNLLEICIDEKVFSELKGQKEKYDNEIETLRANIVKNKAELEQLGLQDIGQDDDNADEDPAIRDERIRANKLNYRIMAHNQLLENLVQKKGNLEQAINECYSIIRHSSQLAIKNNRNIIKLHGSLPEHENEPFAFDNEYDKRYIISSEDYEHYPQRHEAFTQLMRISLLQGHFCLIGFSGDDPNFLAWVSWIRTIVMRDPDKEKEDVKIYLIDARATASADSHKQQFYKNHRIVHIPLSHPACIRFLEEVSGKAIDAGHTRQVLGALMDYLGDISIVDIPQLSYELLAREKYEQYARSLLNDNRMVDIDHVLSVAGQYYQFRDLKKFNRIPSFDHFINHPRLKFLESIVPLHQQLRENENNERQFLGLVALVFEDVFLPYSAVLEERDFKQLQGRAKELSKDIYYQFLKLALKDAIWRADGALCSALHDECGQLGLRQYEDEDKELLLAMEVAVTLGFGRLKDILEEHLHAGNNSIAMDGYRGILFADGEHTYTAEQRYDLLQESLYGLEMKRMLNGSRDDIKISERQQRLKQHGLRTISDNQEFVLALMNPRKVKVKPYESDEFITRSRSFGSADKFALSLQMMGMMLETGFPLAWRNVYFQSRHEVYAVFQQVFEMYPLPVLYFAFQYSDDKFIKRIGQDYAYSHDLEAHSTRIFELFARSWFDSHTPPRYKKNILIFLSQFIISLEPDTWQPFFFEVWEKKRMDGSLFSKDEFGNHEFIESAIRYCQDPLIMDDVLNDCVNEALRDGGSLHSANRYLHILARNPFQRAHKLNGSQPRHQINIKGIIEAMKKDPGYLFVLGNINTFLRDDDVKVVEEELLKLDYASVESVNLWSVAVYYCGQRTSLQRKVIDEIIKSPQLWRTGISINEDGRRSWSSNEGFIKLRRIRKGDRKERGLVFTPTDVISIYNSLKLSLAEIKAMGDMEIEDSFSLLQEMYWFLDAERQVLKDQPDFEVIKEDVERLLVKDDTDRYIIAGLTSDDLSELDRAIGEVARGLYDKGDFKKHEPHIWLIINKILLKRNPGVISCMEALVTWCVEFEGNGLLRRMGNSLANILSLYRTDYPGGLAVPRVEEWLVGLAVVLRHWGMENEDISFFVGLLDSSRYNNVRYNLKEELRQREVLAE